MLAQVSVINNDYAVSSILLEAGWIPASQGGNTTRPHCSLPLHIASRRGQLDLVNLLLAHGAEPGSVTAAPMCYPRPHRPVRHVPSRFHFIETDVYPCESTSEPLGTALSYALVGDHVGVVRRLLSVKPYCDPGALLLDACRTWAVQCAHHVLESIVQSQLSKSKRTAMVNSVDRDDGLTPLLHAARVGDRSLIVALVERGADTQVRDYRGRTALHHLLFAGPLAHPCDPEAAGRLLLNAADRLDCCNYLLACGLESKTSVTDRVGNTALHAAVDLVNRKSMSDVNNQSSATINVDINELYGKLGVISKLLSHNCDPDVMNSFGVSALHRLILTFDSSASERSLQSTIVCEDESVLLASSNPQFYAVDAASLRLAVETLLDGGASPTLPFSRKTPIELILNCLARLDPHLIRSSPQCLDELKGCLTALCQAGALRSMDTRTHQGILQAVSALGRRCLGLREDCFVADALTCLISDILSTLISYGLDPNRKLTKSSSKEDRRSPETVLSPSISSATTPTVNVLVEVIRLVADVRSLNIDLTRVFCWTLTCLQNGADPDGEPYPPEITNDDVIFQSQGCIFIRPASDVDIRSTRATQQYIDLVANLLIRPRQPTYTTDDVIAVERLLMLFHASMSHSPLYGCLRLSAASLRPALAISQQAVEHGVGRTRSALARALSNMSSRPRSLKQNARLVICVALGRQLRSNVPRLPLPVSLKRYLMDLE